MKFVINYTVFTLCLLSAPHTLFSKRLQSTTKTSIITVSHESFDSIARSKLPIVLNICADWCPHSTAMDPIFKQAAVDNKKTMRFAKISVDNFTGEEPSIAYLKRAYNLEIECVPTFIVIVNNKVVGKVQEQMNLEKFKDSIAGIVQKVTQHPS